MGAVSRRSSTGARLAAVTACIVAITVVPSAADHGGSSPVAIAGHTVDPHGEPLAACVVASNGLLIMDTDIADPATGAYRLQVPPGEYEVQVSEPVELNGTRCPFDGYTFFNYVPQERRVNTLTNTGPVDFTLLYNVGGGVWGPVCCLASAGMPGTVMEPYAQMDLRPADRVRMMWRDESSGIAYEMPRLEGFWKERYGIAGWQMQWAIPIDRPDGVYASTFYTIDDAGLVVSDEFTVTTIVDSVAPVIADSFPADGMTGVPPTRLTPWFIGSDQGAGIADFRTTMKVIDVLTGEQAGWLNDFDQRGSRVRSRRSVDLEPERTYRAELRVLDNAGNQTFETFTFTTGDGVSFSDPSPTGSTTDPHERISVGVGGSVDESTLEMTVWSNGVAYYHGSPSFDADTRRAYVQPGDLNGRPDEPRTRMPAMVPGVYEVDLSARELHTDRYLTMEWAFVVRADPERMLPTSPGAAVDSCHPTRAEVPCMTVGG